MMVISEKEAKTMMCCGPMLNAKCKASKCMAWRWAGITYSDTKKDGTVIKSGVRLGFCGLSGKP